MVAQIGTLSQAQSSLVTSLNAQDRSLENYSFFTEVPGAGESDFHSPTCSQMVECDR